MKSQIPNPKFVALLKRELAGQLLIQVLVFGAIAAFLVGSFVQWAGLQIKAGRELLNREQAFQIAEAGQEYYRWHLAHAPEDFQDGTGQAGPYSHEYYDKDGGNIGRFILTITPPPLGSTLVTVVSEGKVYADPNISRKIKVQLGIPSWAKYAVAANDVMRFGSGTEVFGEIYSNAGIRFDALAHNLVSSAKDKYNDPDHGGGDEFGVHTHVSPADPLPPNPVPQRPDVFMAGRKFPVPELDFSGLAANLSQLKARAQESGRYFAGSGAQGYNLVLKTDDTFNLYKVTALAGASASCRSGGSGQAGWGTWSIQTETLLGTYAFPANGIVFFEDQVWVEGQISGARLTIVSARFPESPATNTSITVNKDVFYTAYDGSDVIGFIAQNNFNVGLKSDNDLRIDGAIIAKNGRAGRYYYRSSCGTEYRRDSLTLYGTIATNQRYGFAYTDGTGYQIRNINYDAALLYAPPPSFPLTSDRYSTLSWEEMK